MNADAIFEGFLVSDVLFCINVGILCNADDLEGAALVADRKRDLLREYTPSLRTVPTEDVMVRLLMTIEPKELVPLFAESMARATHWPAEEIVKLHGTPLPGVKRAALHKRATGVIDQLDVDEESDRVRLKNVSNNFVELRHIALNMLALVKTPKLSFPMKRLTALLDESYLRRVLRPPSTRTKTR